MVSIKRDWLILKHALCYTANNFEASAILRHTCFWCFCRHHFCYFQVILCLRLSYLSFSYKFVAAHFNPMNSWLARVLHRLRFPCSPALVLSIFSFFLESWDTVTHFQFLPLSEAECVQMLKLTVFAAFFCSKLPPPSYHSFFSFSHTTHPSLLSLSQYDPGKRPVW